MFVNQTRSVRGEPFGGPVADKQRAKEKHQDERWSISDPKLIVSALFKESGEVAPVDLRQFGKRAGEIIARATHMPRRRPH
jgi:hypothetical protein